MVDLGVGGDGNLVGWRLACFGDSLAIHVSRDMRSVLILGGARRRALALLHDLDDVIQQHYHIGA